MIFILAVAVAIVLGALARRAAANNRLGTVARGAAAVAGFIAGFVGTYVVVNHI